MTHRSILPSGKLPATILLCMMLVACSTTQKSGAGTGATQEAAPIADATASGAQSESPSGDAAQSAQPETPPDSGAAASGTSQQAGAAAGDAEAERLKQQLADQEAEINRLRQEQLDSQQLADQEAARERATATQAGQGEQPSVDSQQPATSADAASSSAAASSGADEPLPTFPEQSAAAEPLQHSVYFEFDNAVIKDEYDSMLIGHAAYLKAHPDFNAEVQGNCDERGSREYNLALGARRAEAVKRALELAGADGGKIKTVSFGAEKPVAYGQDEESYRQNRRADILY
jgi:peptidoglycan-associated lipoprotein